MDLALGALGVRLQALGQQQYRNARQGKRSRVLLLITLVMLMDPLRRHRELKLETHASAWKARGSGMTIRDATPPLP